jgi:hypothetical protein
VIPLCNLPVSVQSTKKVRQMTLVPQNTPLKFELKGSRIEFTLPELNGHQMIVVQA